MVIVGNLRQHYHAKVYNCNEGGQAQSYARDYGVVVAGPQLSLMSPACDVAQRKVSCCENGVAVRTKEGLLKTSKTTKSTISDPSNISLKAVAHFRINLVTIHKQDIYKPSKPHFEIRSVMAFVSVQLSKG